MPLPPDQDRQACVESFIKCVATHLPQRLLKRCGIDRVFFICDGRSERV